MTARDPRRALGRAVRQHVESLQAFGVTAVPKAVGPSTGRSEPGRSRDRSAVTGVSAERPANDKVKRLNDLAAQAQQCKKCSLYRTRTHCVFSDGSSQAQLMFIGEAPGRDEDLQGIPFVGAAGQLLTKMIVAMGLRREDVYICNVLKDRPPGNRTPLPEEVDACMPFLVQQLAIIQPKVICVLGAVAAKALLGPHVAITKIRGQVWDYQGTPLVPTFHPAYLLRNPPAKKFAWEDLKRVKKLLDAPRIPHT